MFVIGPDNKPNIPSTNPTQENMYQQLILSQVGYQLCQRVSQVSSSTLLSNQ